MGETKKRSIVKAISWRITATLITVALIYIFTSHIALALSIGLLETLVKMAVYYTHERAWNKIWWGKE